MPKKKKGPPKRRNPYTLIARMRNSAGPMGAGRGRPDKEQSRTACRGKVRVEDYLDEDEPLDNEYEEVF